MNLGEKMYSVNNTSRVLGAAFLLPFLTSFTSAAILKKVWLVPGNTIEMILRIANNPWQIRTIILLDMLTAMGVIFLGCNLFLILRKQNERAALIAMGFYLLEGVLLAVSTTEAFSLLRISQEYAITANSALQMMGQLTYESMNFVGDTLHMLAFCLGGILFYALLYKSGVVPRAISLWGLIATFPMLIGSLTQLFGYRISFLFYLPYVPFELVIGVWILVKGIPDTELKFGGNA
jgi:hypothetical protein